MQVFNIVLLSLSISTILLTLISYILYKVRQLPKQSPGGVEGKRVKVEGLYFTRYVPGASETVPPVGAQARALATRRRYLPQTTGAFFVLVVSIVFMALMIQYYFILNRRGDLLSDSERKALISQGLIKHRVLVRMPSERLREEYLFPEEKARVEILLTKLRDAKIILLQSQVNRATDHKREMASMSDWSAFLDDEKIPYHVASDLSAVRAGTDLVILPHAVYMDAKEYSAITAALEMGISFLATGPIGMGNNGPESADWRESTFGIRFLTNPLASNSYPTIFATGVAPWWDIPSGLEASWYPKDIEFKAIATNGVSALYEGDFQGFFNGIEGNPSVTKVTRAQFVVDKPGRAAWLALDPSKVGNELTEVESFYVRSALLHTLAWSARIPSARVSTWKDGHKAAMVVFVDTEDKFENILAMADMFKQDDLPVTYFVVSNLFKQHPEMVSHMTPQMDIESHSENHKTFYLQPLVEQFDRIQTSRMEIEPISKKPVMGFRPPTEKDDNDTINAALQNGLDFFVGERTFHRFSPAWIASGKMIFFSRLLNDDISLRRSGMMEVPEDLIAAVTRECDHVGSLNGLYLLGLHTQTFPKEQLDTLSRALDALKARKYWETNFPELVTWLRDREAIDVELLRGDTENSYRLVVNNGTDARLDNLYLELDTGKTEGLQVANRSLASEGTITILREKEVTESILEHLGPKQRLELPLVSDAPVPTETETKTGEEE